MPEPRTSRAPTPIQLATLAFMRAFTAEHGMPPTVREIGEHFGHTSFNATHQRLTSMKRKGLVTHTPMIARGWRPA